MQLLIEETPLEKAIRESMPACDLTQVEVQYFMEGLKLETEPAFIAGMNSRLEQIMTDPTIVLHKC